MAPEQSEDFTDEERALFGAFNDVANAALRCRELREINVSASGAGMAEVVNCLMTELWDQGFSQTEIRNAFVAALADMNRYAAGEERRS